MGWDCAGPAPISQKRALKTGTGRADDFSAISQLRAGRFRFGLRRFATNGVRSSVSSSAAG